MHNKLQELSDNLENFTFEGAKQHIKEAFEHIDAELTAAKTMFEQLAHRLQLQDEHINLLLQAAHIHADDGAVVVQENTEGASQASAGEADPSASQEPIAVIEQTNAAATESSPTSENSTVEATAEAAAPVEVQPANAWPPVAEDNAMRGKL